MATSFGALCTDFYVNQTLTLRMDLPAERETVLHFFERVRADQPSLSRFRPYPDELSLESNRRAFSYRWLALRRRSIRSGHANPDTLDEAYALHRLLLRMSPYHLSISPLDVAYQELTFGFELEAKANHNQIVLDALFAESPMAGLLDQPGAQPLSVQPAMRIALNDRCSLRATFEVKTATTPAQVRRGRYRTEPITILLHVRQLGPINKPDDLLDRFETLREHAEQLAADRLVPDLLTPISRSLTNIS